MREPKSLTKSAIGKLTREELVTWATSRCLLEHLDTAEVNALSKSKLLDQVMGALLFAEVAEDHYAAGHDTVARSLDDLI